MRKLLDTEASISLEAKAALEEAQGALATAKAEAAQQLAKLRRDLDHRCACLVAALCEFVFEHRVHRVQSVTE